MVEKTKLYLRQLEIIPFWLQTVLTKHERFSYGDNNIPGFVIEQILHRSFHLKTLNTFAPLIQKMHTAYNNKYRYAKHHWT